MATDGTILQAATPAAVGLSAAQLERAFGLLTAAIEAGQISAASLTVHSQFLVRIKASEGKRGAGDFLFNLRGAAKAVAPVLGACGG